MAPPKPMPPPAEPIKRLPAADTADDILGCDDLETVAVEVKEWKRTVYLRVLPADEGLRINEQLQALPKGQQSEAMFLLLGASLVTASGERLLKTPDDLQRLRSRSQKVLLRLQDIALELQGWTPRGAEKNA